MARWRWRSLPGLFFLLSASCVAVATQPATAPALLPGQCALRPDGDSDSGDATPREPFANASTAPAAAPTDLDDRDAHQSTPPPPLLLLIGVKTSVLRGQRARRAIRETWAHPSALPEDVRVVFLGCQPPGDGDDGDDGDDLDPARAATRAAIDRERRRHRDLLIDELESCRDGYAHLVDKVTAFFHWATTTHPQATATTTRAAFVMLVDDDVYLRVPALARRLRDPAETPRARFYAGQVWATQHRRPIRPLRAPGDKNFIPRAVYPLDELVPFANGPHYLVSADCAAFIARNRRELRGLAGLDDVSVALWLLGLQVHPRHYADFQNLRDGLCDDRALAVADLTSAAIRLVHVNLHSGRPLCHGFADFAWIKRRTGADTRGDGVAVDPALASTLLSATAAASSSSGTWSSASASASSSSSFSPPIALAWDVGYDSPRAQLFVALELRVGGAQAGPMAFTFHPAVTPFEIFGDFVGEMFRLEHPHALVRGLTSADEDQDDDNDEAENPQRDLVAGLRAQLSAFVRQSRVQAPTLGALLTILAHNLPLPASAPLLVVGYSPGAAYSKVVLECLFAAMYPRRQLMFLDDAATLRGPVSRTTPDVFVFSALDGGCSRGWTDACQHAARGYVDRYTAAASRRTRLLMISGEAWALEAVDPRVIVLSTVLPVVAYAGDAAGDVGDDEDAHARRHVYLSMASLSFGERRRHRPMDLLTPTHSTSERRFCAYMYAQCNRPHREYMFDLLDALEPVDALGACQGTKRPIDYARRRRRHAAFYNDEAVELFAQYDFVIAFENAAVPGYVTEKLVNALLAGSIPIYFGHSPTVARVFNPERLIDCGRFRTLRDCAAFVVRVHRAPELKARIRRAPIVANATAFAEAFSWHPEVPSAAHALRLRRLLALDDDDDALNVHGG